MTRNSSINLVQLCSDMMVDSSPVCNMKGTGKIGSRLASADHSGHVVYIPTYNKVFHL